MSHKSGTLSFYSKPCRFNYNPYNKTSKCAGREEETLVGNITCTWTLDFESASSSAVFSVCPMMMLADSADSHMRTGLNCVKEDFIGNIRREYRNIA